jgi:hypothetical protein
MAKPFLIFRPRAPGVWYIFAVSGSRACMTAASIPGAENSN